MTKEEINQVIHEAIHGPVEFKEITRHYKTKTLLPKIYYRGKDNMFKQLPSYASSWADYGIVLGWAMKQKWWDDFSYTSVIYEATDPRENAYGLNENLLNPMTGSTALAEFIKTNPELLKEE